jgi:hypothetical protein
LLAALNCSPEYLERLFAKSEGFYLAFVEATQPLGLEGLSKLIWESANTENGGFQERATVYARGTGVQ